MQSQIAGARGTREPVAAFLVDLMVPIGLRRVVHVVPVHRWRSSFTRGFAQTEVAGLASQEKRRGQQKHSEKSYTNPSPFLHITEACADYARAPFR